jgi:DNA-binding transcriptional MocR family regulator
MKMLTELTKTIEAPHVVDTLDHEPAPPIAAATEFTEEQARVFLAECVKRPSLRSAAETLGWTKSRVERFYARLDSETVPKTPTTVPEVNAPRVEPEESEADESRRMFRADNPDLLTYDQPATCCYLNPFNQIVIRQESSASQDEDPFVRFEAHHIDRLIARLQELKREATS